MKVYNRSFLIGVFLVFFSAFCFALKGVFIKKAYEYENTSIGILCLRMFFSFPFYGLILFFYTQKNNSYLPKVSWSMMIFLSVIGYYLSSFFDFVGLQYIPISLERILLFVYPTFVLVINYFLFKKPVLKIQILALLITYLGIFLSFSQLQISGESAQNLWIGSGFVVLAGLCYAIYLVGGDTQLRLIGTLPFTCLVMMLGAVAVFFHALFTHQLSSIFHYKKEFYMYGFIIAVVSTIIPTFALNEGIKRIGSSNAAILGSIGPIFTLVFATSFLGESIPPIQTIGTILVLIGVFLVGKYSKK